MLFHFSLSAAIAVTVGASAVNCAPTTTDPVVKTLNGSYVGVYDSVHHQDQFLGVPYAQPPLGDLRFRPPQSLNTTWSGNHNATSYRLSCQGYLDESRLVLPQGEDCLSVHITRPAGKQTGLLPVAFWIHGGGWYYGSGAEGFYNSSLLIERSVNMGQPIMTVHVNYRLAAWGWLWSDEVLAEGSTNVGLRDQRMALRWVQENIEAFGGDPKKVTIFGESAGAGSVGKHLLAYNGRNDGLFHGAISQSGSPAGVGVWEPSHEKLASVTYNVTQTVCPHATNKLDCLRKASFEEIHNATRTTVSLFPVAYGPVVDGDILARPAAEQLRDGSFVKVPYIMGTNNDEASIYTPLGLNTAADVFDSLVSATNNVDFTIALGLMSRYPKTDNDGVLDGVPFAHFNTTVGLQFKRFLAIMSDGVFIAPTQFSANLWQRHNNSTNLYVYNANVTISQGGNWYGAGHSFDLPYVFRSLTGVGWEDNGEPPFAGGNPFAGRPQSYIDLADVMSGMWIGFFNNLVPHYANQPVPEWPAFRGEDPSLYIFDAQPDKLNTRVGKELRKEKNKWFASQLYPESK
ncbi:lipase 2 [Plectosphaerella plurivora]|uniref:Carboxylic ester hydrolase n=1 Tax=Plectosphaerella plurivora TaxID=936078 RepID=A0A9P9A360_9PEZI|nr:lipase 2 [Plectosphaerella plurivora]